MGKGEGMKTIRPTVKIYATKKYCEIHGKDNGCAFMMPSYLVPAYSVDEDFDCTLFRGDDGDFVSLDSDKRGVLRCQACIESEEPPR